jgi:hypothetical protein
LAARTAHRYYFRSMRTLLLLTVIALATSCSKDPVQRQVHLRATCGECDVEWNTSMGNSGNFHLFGDTSFSTMVDVNGHFRIGACTVDPWAFPPGDTVAAVYSSGEGVPTRAAYTFVDSCAMVGENVPGE